MRNITYRPSNPHQIAVIASALALATLLGLVSLEASAQISPDTVHVNNIEQDKQTIEDELASMEAHMGSTNDAMTATLNNERAQLEASFNQAQQAVELAVGNARLAAEDAEQFQLWAEGRLTDTEMAQTQTKSEADELYIYANTAEQAATDAVHNRAGETALLQSAVTTAVNLANSATSSADRASTSATNADKRRDDALAWRNRAQNAYTSANNDSSLANTAKNAAQTARTAAIQARNAAQTARNSAQNLTGSAAALRTHLINRANQTATNANKIANDVDDAASHYSTVASLLNTVKGRQTSYLAKLVWAENNIPQSCFRCTANDLLSSTYVPPGQTYTVNADVIRNATISGPIIARGSISFVSREGTSWYWDRCSWRVNTTRDRYAILCNASGNGTIGVVIRARTEPQPGGMGGSCGGEA